MKVFLGATALLLLLVGCDRRDDAGVSLDSQEVSSPPGERAGSNAGTLAPPPTSTPAMDPTGQPAVSAKCNGFTGAMLEQCIKQEDAGEQAAAATASESKDDTRIP